LNLFFISKNLNNTEKWKIFLCDNFTPDKRYFNQFAQIRDKHSNSIF
jgi:hypothetical protein